LRTRTRSQSCAPSHPSLSSSLSAPCRVSLPASAAIAGISTSPACTPRPAPNTSLIASSHFPQTQFHEHKLTQPRPVSLGLSHHHHYRLCCQINRSPARAGGESAGAPVPAPISVGRGGEGVAILLLNAPSLTGCPSAPVDSREKRRRGGMWAYSRACAPVRSDSPLVVRLGHPASPRSAARCTPAQPARLPFRHRAAASAAAAVLF
jgi:hypothetical protein